MSTVRRSYSAIRDLIQPGDIVAFGGRGGLSNLIKRFTRGEVSHVGIVLQSALLLRDERQPGRLVQIIESTSLGGFSGVSITRFSDRVATYDGEIWWLPLSDGVRKAIDATRLYDFLLHQDRKPYDAPQALGSALDLLDDLGFSNNEAYARFFCSELVAAGLKAAGAVPDGINPSEVTPLDLCRWEIYAGVAYQLKGEPTEISGFNTREVGA